MAVISVNVSDLAGPIHHIKRRLAARDDGCGDAAPQAAAVLERFSWYAPKCASRAMVVLLETARLGECEVAAL